MQKFMNFLDNIGARYDIQAYGESYFPNAPEVHYNAICICFDFMEYDYTELKQKENEIKRYLKRRKNLVIFREWLNCSGFGFCVASIEDREEYTNYRKYMDASISEWEQVAHNLYISGQPEKVNSAARDIMEKYEKEYIISLFHAVKQAV